MLEVSVSGNIDLLISITQGMPSPLEQKVFEGIVEVALRIFDAIWRDPNIPQSYKESLAVVERPEEHRVIIGPVWDYASIIEHGSETDWIKYKCSKRAYYGGKLNKRVVGKAYLAEYWTSHRDYILQDLIVTVHRKILELFGR